MASVFYHSTNREAAEAILREGFRDTQDTYGTDREFEGVWLADQPLSAGQGGVAAETVLRVTFPDDLDAYNDFEWTEEGKPYREWLIPASRINGIAQIEMMPDGDYSPCDTGAPMK